MPSMLRAKLGFGDACAHDACRRETPRNKISCLVDKLGTAPLLMRQSLYALLALFPLDELHIRSSATFGIFSGENVDAKGVTMEESIIVAASASVRATST